MILKDLPRSRYIGCQFDLNNRDSGLSAFTSFGSMKVTNDLCIRMCSIQAMNFSSTTGYKYEKSKEI